MKKYLIEKGYKFKDGANDMTHKQFYLTSVVYANSETSTMGNLTLDRQETYTLFLKEIDTSTFKDTLESILNSALTGGVNVSLDNSVTVENVENGYNITLAFVIQG